MVIAEYIKQKKVKAKLMQLHTAFPTLKHAARYLSIKLEQFYKVHVLQGENKRYVICVAPSDETIDFKKVENLTGIRRLRFADTEAVMKVTGFSAGITPPFGFSEDITVLVEKDIMEHEEGFTYAGDESLLVKMQPREIVRVNDAQMVDIISREEDEDEDEDEDDEDDEDKEDEESVGCIVPVGMCREMYLRLGGANKSAPLLNGSCR